MKKEDKLVNKIKRLLRRLKVPRYLHRYGTSVSSRSAQMIRAELYCRLNCNNLFLKIIEI